MSDLLGRVSAARAVRCDVRCWRIGAAATYVDGVCDECGSPEPSESAEVARKTYEDALDSAAALFYGPMTNGTIADELMAFRAAGVKVERGRMTSEIRTTGNYAIRVGEFAEGWGAALEALEYRLSPGKPHE